MSTDQVLSTARQIIGYVGLALVVVAAAKFFGFAIPMRGSVSDTALVAIACLMAR